MAAQLRVEDYTVGWVCTTHIELAAASEMLDEEHESLPQNPNDSNVYTFGRCGSHRVVIACLPAGQRGTSSAATVALQMKSTFMSLRFGLLVGIGGGVPTTDIRLGDVVVSRPDRQFGGVVQYDTGERRADGRFLRTGLLNTPPPVLLTALQKLKSNHLRGINKCVEYLNIICDKKGLGFARPEGRDLLFQAGYKHTGGYHCKDCDTDGLVARELREQIVVHYGTIASGNLDVRDSDTRKQLSDDLGGVLCLETEAAGLMNSFPCLVIRGICDYADSHKNEKWHKYAAATAAAYAKDLLTVIPVLEVENTRAIRETVYAKKAKSLQMIPFPRNEDVVIREGIFSELEKKLPVTSRHQSAALWGLGGSGKTQVALEFAYRRYDATSCSIFWVHADNFASFLHDYKAIAKSAKLEDKLESEDLMDAVRAWIETQSNWLLVLDNADALHHFGEQYASHSHDNSRNLHSFIPRGPTGTILWTTRDGRIVGDLISSKQGINVGSMDASEAKELLIGLSDSAITNGDTPAIDELIHKLDLLPLAISQAAAYIRRTSTTIQDYVEKIKKEKRRWKLLDESKFDRHRRPNVPNSVMKTWQISIDCIREENPCAYTILHVIAYFNNQNMPFELIKAAVRSNFGQEDNKDEQDDDIDTESNESEDDDDIVEAATRLNEFSFLRLRNSKSGLRTYEMHKLVQEATRYALGKKESERFSKSALKIMLEVFPTSNPDTWDRCEVYLPHALAVSNCLEISQEIGVSDLLHVVGEYLHSQFRSRETEPINLKVLKLRKEVLGERHPKTIRSMASLASTYLQQGRFKEAEEIGIKALALQKEVLGERHPDTILSMVNLVAIYGQQGRLKEAEEISVKVLVLRKKGLGERHPATILSMANLVATYSQQGRFKEAEEIGVKAFALQKEVLGERHPNTIWSMASLVAIYGQQGRLKEAEEIGVKALALQKEVLGERHPNTIWSMANLVAIYGQQGRLKEAEEIGVKALVLRKEVLGERHPTTIQSIASLAVTYYQQCRLKEAEEIGVEALALQREVLGEGHPDTIRSIGNLALTYHQQGRLKEAEEIGVKALVLRKELLGERHPATIWSMANLVATYHQQGRFKEAEEIGVKALVLRKEVLGERHPKTIHSMASLASTYLQQGRFKEAEEIGIKALALQKEVLGERHSDTIHTMVNLAETYREQGQSVKAEELEQLIANTRIS